MLDQRAYVKREVFPFSVPCPPPARHCEAAAEADEGRRVSAEKGGTYLSVTSAPLAKRAVRNRELYI